MKVKVRWFERFFSLIEKRVGFLEFRFSLMLNMTFIDDGENIFLKKKSLVQFRNVRRLEL